MDAYSLKKYDLLFFNVVSWDSEENIISNDSFDRLEDAMEIYKKNKKRFPVVEVYETNMYCLERNERK